MNEEEIKTHKSICYITEINSYSDDLDDLDDLSDFVDRCKEKLNELLEKNNTSFSQLSIEEDGQLRVQFYRRETDEETIKRVENQNTMVNKNNKLRALQTLKENQELLTKIKSGADLNDLIEVYK